MKTFYFILAGCCFAVAGYSQINEPLIKKMPPAYNPQMPDLLLKPIVPFSSSPHAKLLSENKMGKVYSLALDNMPCLVPNLQHTTPIPTKKLQPGNFKMPNKFSTQMPDKGI